MKPKSFFIALFGLAAALMLSNVAHADATLNFKVKLRSGSHVTIQATVLENTNADDDDDAKTILFLHGLAHTGNTFRPMVQQLFAGPTGHKVRNAILINLPNRGGSGLPFGTANVRYGDLDLNDYAAALMGALHEFLSEGIAPSIIVGHSMGGLILQVAQESLLSQGTSLKNAFGVDKVVLLDSSAPAAVPHPLLDGGTGLFLLSLFTTENQLLGTFVSIDAASFLQFFFTDLLGQFVPGTPTVEDLTALGYKADESYAAAVQTIGTSNLRPNVRSGAFAPATGTEARVIVGEQDIFNSQNQQTGLYQFLTGDSTLSDFQVIRGADPVHDQYISNPAAVIPALGL